MLFQALLAFEEAIASPTPCVLAGIEPVLLKGGSVDKVTVTGRTPVLGSSGKTLAEVFQRGG